MSENGRTPGSSKGAVVHGIKGYDKDLACHPDGGPRQQYEVGKTYKHNGPVKACESGFHAITGHPLAVFKYYQPAGSRFTRVELSGALHSDDGVKTAAEVLKVGQEIGLGDLAVEAVKWVFDRAKWSDGPVSTLDGEGATASGSWGAATASGYQGAATASGYQGAATASGDQGAATASGYQGAATASGDQGAATASGYQGAATASGYQGAATASGDQGAATASGYQGAATASGKFCGAYATGHFGSVSGADGSALHLDERIWAPGHDDHGKIIAVWAGIVGRDGIKPGVRYTLKDGHPVEVA
jgi:hypothetical protein